MTYILYFAIKQVLYDLLLYIVQRARDSGDIYLYRPVSDRVRSQDIFLENEVFTKIQLTFIFLIPNHVRDFALQTRMKTLRHVVLTLTKPQLVVQRSLTNSEPLKQKITSRHTSNIHFTL